MLRGVKELQGFSIQATDGDIGSIKDVFFDAEQWTIRYFVVETGPLMFGRHVLISPVAVQTPLDWKSRSLPVDLTKEQVKDSPDIDTDRPVSRQVEIAQHDYYRWPYYWGGDVVGGTVPGLGVAAEAYLIGDDDPRPLPHSPAEVAQDSDSYLHSARDVIGYKIGATDEDFGHVDDFLIEDGSWVIRYLVVDTSGLLEASHRTLVAPPWIKEVSWKDSRVYVDLPRAKVESAPPFNPAESLDREYEEMLHEHYGQPQYWRETAKRR